MPQMKDLRRAVLTALVADPRVRSGHIAVDIQAGVVTLSGHVLSSAQRDAACRTVRLVSGVTALIDRVIIAVPVCGGVARIGA